MKGELGGKIMTQFVALRPKTYSYIIDDGSKDKIARNKKLINKTNPKFNNYKNCLLNSQIILKLQQRLQSKVHNVYSEQINKSP